MPAKVLKLQSGRIVEIKAIRLSNGNLLIPARDDADRTQAVWKEVAPGTSDFKRWLPVACDDPDPRGTV